MAPWRPTVHVWPTLWNTKKFFHPNVQPVQFSSWYLPPFGFYGSLKKCHFSLSWEWFSLFPFFWGGGAPHTPSHISKFGPLGFRNNQHQFFFALSQWVYLKYWRSFYVQQVIVKLSFTLILHLQSFDQSKNGVFWTYWKKSFAYLLVVVVLVVVVVVEIGNTVSRSSSS